MSNYQHDDLPQLEEAQEGDQQNYDHYDGEEPQQQQHQGQQHQPTSTANDVTPDHHETEDPEIAEMKRRVRELEEEEAMINAATQAASSSSSNNTSLASSSSSSSYQNSSNGQQQQSNDVDARSVYVGNVDYSSTKEELDSLFSACGVVNRVTILYDKYTGHPKGFAYIEFQQPESVQHATLLNDTEFKGRQLKVIYYSIRPTYRIDHHTLLSRTIILL